MVQWLRLALFGAFGAILPEIVLLYSKRWTMPHLEFSEWQYALITALYMGSSAVVAAIFPYRGTPTPWKAVTVGIGLPTIISAATGAVNRALNPVINGGTRGVDEPVSGTFIDLLSLF